MSQATIAWLTVAIIFIVIAILTVGGLVFAIWCYRRVRTDYNNLEIQMKYDKDGKEIEKDVDEVEEEIAENRLPQRRQQTIDLSIVG